MKPGVSLLVLAFCASAAEAQTRYVTFGDSLSDNGNLYAATGGTQPPSPPYYDGRFSNGPVWIENIAGPQAGWAVGVTSGNLNFAFGGARTDTTVASPPGTSAQINRFFAEGGTFAPTDVVTLWAGANDIFQAISVTANQNVAAMGAVAVTAATNVATQVGQLAAGGARTILVLNLPDFGGLPQFNTTAAAPLASYTTSTYNAILKAELAKVAAANPDARILQVNIAALNQAILANPTAFGFTNVTQSCVGLTSCEGYAYFDEVHPTAAGHLIIAAAANNYLNAQDRALSAASLSEVGLANRRSFSYRALERMRNYKPVAGKTDIYVSVIGDQTSSGSRGNLPGYTYGMAGLEFGVLHHATSEISLGFALAAQTGEAKSNTAYGNTLSYQPTSFAADVMARWTNGGSFVQAGLGASINRSNEFKRGMMIGDLVNTASALGRGASAIIETGHHFTFGALTLTPSIKGGVLYASTDAFEETGAIAPLAYSSRSVSTIVAAADIKAEMALSQSLSGHVIMGYEAYFGQSNGAQKGFVADSPGSDFANTIKRMESPGFTFGLGLSGLVANVPVTAEYRGAASADGRSQHRGTVSARIGF